MSAENWIAKFFRDPVETIREGWFEMQKPHDRFSGSRMQVLYTATLILAAVFCGLYTWLTQAYWPVLIPLGIGALWVMVSVRNLIRQYTGVPKMVAPKPKRDRFGLARWLSNIAIYIVWSVWRAIANRYRKAYKQVTLSRFGYVASVLAASFYYLLRAIK